MMKIRPVHVALLATAVGAALVPVIRRRMRHAGSPSGPKEFEWLGRAKAALERTTAESRTVRASRHLQAAVALQPLDQEVVSCCGPFLSFS